MSVWDTRQATKYKYDEWCTSYRNARTCVVLESSACRTSCRTGRTRTGREFDADPSGKTRPTPRRGAASTTGASYEPPATRRRRRRRRLRCRYCPCRCRLSRRPLQRPATRLIPANTPTHRHTPSATNHVSSIGDTHSKRTIHRSMLSRKNYVQNSHMIWSWDRRILEQITFHWQSWNY